MLINVILFMVVVLASTALVGIIKENVGLWEALRWGATIAVVVYLLAYAQLWGWLNPVYRWLNSRLG